MSEGLRKRLLQAGLYAVILAVGGSWYQYHCASGFTLRAYAEDLNPTFQDVPTTHWAYSSIESLYGLGVTKGCKDGFFCPDEPVTRAQMAVFLERGMKGGQFQPPKAQGVFTDLFNDHWAADWIEQLFQDGITKGCSSQPLLYCPEQLVTRAEMAVLLARARYGQNFKPQEASGVFADVPKEHWAAGWIESLYEDGITQGCSGTSSNYCPESSVTRAEMVVFLVRAFIGQGYTKTDIGPEGGIVEITDPNSALFGTKIKIPPEALSTTKSLSIAGCKTLSSTSFAEVVLDLEPKDVEFNKPARIEVPLDSVDFDVGKQIAVVAVNQDDIQQLAANVEDQSIVFEVDRLSSVMIFSDDRLTIVLDIPPRYLPAGAVLYTLTCASSCAWLPGHTGMLLGQGEPFGFETIVESTPYLYCGFDPCSSDGNCLGVRFNSFDDFAWLDNTHIYMGARLPAEITEEQRYLAATFASGKTGYKYQCVGASAAGDSFSCVGLVEAAYDYAGFEIVPTNVALLPKTQYNRTEPVKEITARAGEPISIPVGCVADTAPLGIVNYSDESSLTTIHATGIPEGAVFSGPTGNPVNEFKWTPRCQHVTGQPYIIRFDAQLASSPDIQARPEFLTINVVAGQEEICDDGFDNDCDGQIDEGCAKDSDKDGVADDIDNCPNIYNPNQADVDADGIGDSCDPQNNNDSDKDGVLDTNDTCPATPAGSAVDSNGCSASQKDSDSDGIFDDKDKCANTPIGETVDQDGCSGSQRDADGDGYYENQDCNDKDLSIHPGAIEICNDAKDNDCDGVVDEDCSTPPPDPNDVDNDEDGYTENQGDCNDGDKSIHPGAAEICDDAKDNDCNGKTDCEDVQSCAGFESCENLLPQEIELIKLVNQKREEYGLAPLKSVHSLNSAARRHSDDMAEHNFMDHTGSDGSSPWSRMMDAGYYFMTAAENIAAGYSTPASVLSGWMSSSGHRANILNPGFCDIGVGYAYSLQSSYGHYWTLDFGCQ